MKNIYFFSILALLTSFAFVSCAESESEESAQSQFRSVLVLNALSGIDYESFNQSNWEGHLQAQEELGYDVNYITTSSTAEYNSILSSVATSEPTLIWGNGYTFAETFEEAAKNFPEQNFAIVDFSFEDSDISNIISVTFSSQEPSFLAGYLAALQSKNKKVGFLGGRRSFVISAFHYPFQAGVEYANFIGAQNDPNYVPVQFYSSYIESFTNASFAKQLSLDMVQSGVDVFFAAAGGAGDGVFEAVKENDLFIIGVDSDQYALAPQNVITSVVKGVDKSVYYVLEKFKNDPTQAQALLGTTINFDLTSGAVYLSDLTNTSEDIKKDVNALTQQLSSGNLEVEIPVKEDDLGAFRDSLASLRQ